MQYFSSDKNQLKIIIKNNGNYKKMTWHITEMKIQKGNVLYCPKKKYQKAKNLNISQDFQPEGQGQQRGLRNLLMGAIRRRASG